MPALFVTLLCMAVTAVGKYSAKKGDYIGKQVGYRLLAETNRVLEFTTGLGKPYSGDKFLDENAVRDNWCHGHTGRNAGKSRDRRKWYLGVISEMMLLVL